MGKRSEVERFGDLLDRLLDGEQVGAEDEAMDSLLEVARRLRDEAPPNEPDPAFQARLREDLVANEIDRPGRRADLTARDGWYFPRIQLPRWSIAWEPSRRLAGVACVALILIVTAIWLIPWSKSPNPSGELGRIPSLLGVASAYAEQVGEDFDMDTRGQLADVTFRLAAALPKAAKKATVYRQVREPIDKSGSTELARRLGITVAQVVDNADDGVFVVTGEGGRLVVSKAFRGYFYFETNPSPSANPLSPSAPPPAVAPPGAAITPAPDGAQAARDAEEFLRTRGLLSFDYVVEVRDDAPPGATPLYRQVSFIPTAEGRAVRGLGLVATVGPGGKVTSIQSSYAKLVPSNAYPILSPEQAYQQLQQKHMETFQLQVRRSSGSGGMGFSAGVSSVYRSAEAMEQAAQVPTYRVGDNVELEGLLSATVFESKDGRRRYQATLLVGPREARTAVQYRLLGTAVEALSQLAQQHVRVWGRVEGLSTRPPGGRLTVQRFEKLYPKERLVALLGQIQIEGERDLAAPVLITDDGKKYALESPGGARYQRENQGRRVIVEGRTTERTSGEGYPVIELAGTRGGTDVDRMTDLSGYQVQLPQVVPEREPHISGEAVVTRAALEYYSTAAAGLSPRFAASDLEPFLLVQPIYTFSGTFDEGKGSFEASVQAVRPEYVGEVKEEAEQSADTSERRR
ncbi:MAG: hypothetical protein EPO21_14525 [Chloroflexota bacterium]|nr:MAG: hypothetical protein EPO21_14525 [Chloroflexota bacterium]